MARDWASKHSVEGYERAAKIMTGKFVYERMAYEMRRPRYVREELEAGNE